MKPLCEKCGLYKEGCLTPHISSSGDENPDILFIGEAPGRDEDKQGIPFVGKSGKYLRRIVKEIFKGKKVRYTNVVRCRPPNNLLDKKHWIECCSPELDEDIERYKPKVVVCLGAKASHCMSLSLNAIRPLDRNGIKFVSAYHPSYVLNYSGGNAFDVFIRQLDVAFKCLDENASKDVRLSNPDFTLEYKLITTEESLERLISVLGAKRDSPLAVDIETYPLYPYGEKSKILTVGLALERDKCFCIPWEHSESPFSRDFVLEKLNRIFKNRNNLIMHYCGFDRKWLRLMGVDIPENAVCFDTMLANYQMNPSKRFNALKQLVGIYYPEIAGYEQVIEQWFLDNKIPHSRRDYSKIPLRLLAEYNAYDAVAALVIYEKLEGKMGDLRKVHTNLLLPATEFLEDVENNGCKIDMKYHKNLEISLSEEIEDISKKISQLPEVRKFLDDKRKGRQGLLGNEKISALNLNSPLQLRSLLFDYCGLPVISKTPKGMPSIKEPVLNALKNMHILPKLILQHRKLSTLMKMFVKPLPDKVYLGDFIHSRFNLHGTETGRLTSESPNFQQLPKGSIIKKLFISRFDGGKIINADFGQIELRVLACESGDEALKDIFNRGGDLHAETASGVFKVSPEDVTDNQRRVAKYVNFGVLYGRGAKSLVRDIGGTEEEAKKYIKRYFERFPGVKKWRSWMFKEILKRGSWTTKFGRRGVYTQIFDLDINNQHDARRIYGIQNEATNFPIQSQASDMMLISSMLLQKEMKERGMKTCIMGLVHDACVLDVPSDEVEIISSLIKKYMEDLWEGKIDCPDWINRSWIDVPIVVDIEIGDNMGELFQRNSH